MVNLSPCEVLNSKVDSLMAEFNTKAGIVNSSVMELNDTLDVMKTQTGVPDLESQINSMKNESMTQLGNLTTLSNNFTGSCLDGVTSELFGVLNDASSLSSNTFGSIDGLANVDTLLRKLGGVKNSLNGLGIGKLLEKLDESLGCLADNNECIPIDKIDTIMSTINGFLQSNGLSQTGEFSIDSFLENIPDMDSLLKDNIKMISETTDSFESEAKNVVLASTQKAKSYYNPLKW